MVDSAANRLAALWVAERLRDAGHEALFAGGCVRDMLLGAEPADYDVATSATPRQVDKLFPRVVLVGAKFGVAVVMRSDEAVEVAIDRIGLGDIHALLVLDEDDDLVGIVTNHDLLQYLIE